MQGGQYSDGWGSTKPSVKDYTYGEIMHSQTRILGGDSFSTAEKANLDLAALLGWTSIFSCGGAMLGTPPPGFPQCRWQSMVPDWCGCWKACGELMAEYAAFDGLSLASGVIVSSRKGQAIGHFVISEFLSPAHAWRMAIVWSVMQFLRNAKHER